MPTFKITDPQSGRTVSVTGDTPPSESDIDQIFKSAPTPQPQAAAAPNPVLGFLSGLVKPFVDTGKEVAGAGYEAVRAGRQALGDPNAYVNQQTGQEVPNPFLTDQQLAHPLQMGAKTAAGVLSYAVPFGKGANVATQALLPGATSGVLTAASQGQNPIIGGAEGAAGAGVLHGLGQALAPILNKAGTASDNLGNKLIQSQYLTKPSSKIANDLKGTVTALSRYGVTNPEQMTQVADQVTGADGIVNQIKQKAIADAKPVEIGGVMDIAKQAISQEPLVANTPYAKNLLGIVKNGLYDIAKGDGTIPETTGLAGGDAAFAGDAIQSDKVVRDMRFKQGTENAKAYKAVTGGNASAYNGPLRSTQTYAKDGGALRLTGGDPTKTFKFIQDLEGQAASLRSGNATKTEQSLAKVYKSVANELKDRLFNDAAADTKIQPLTTEQHAALSQISPQLAQDVAGAKTIKELRSIEAPFVRAKNLASESEDRQSIKPFDWGDLGIVGFGGLHPATLGVVAAKKYANSNMGKRQIGGALMGAGNAMRGATPASGGLQALLDMIGAKSAATAGQ